MARLHFKDRYTLDIFTHNIVIKRYCDKKIFFHPIFFPVYLENSYFWTIIDILKCHYNILKKKISFHKNVFLSFYHNIVCKNG